MKPQITPAVKSAVNAYLLARAYAETMRETVDDIQKKLLTSTPYYVDKKKLNRRGLTSERITDPNRTYLMSKTELFDYLCDLKHELIKAKLPVKDVPNEPEHSYYCPALRAESIQRDTEHILIEAVAEMLNETEPKEFGHKLLCNGLDTYKKFIDLSVKMVVNHPDFKNPLTNKPI